MVELQQDESIEELKKKLSKLEYDNKILQDELLAVEKSPYLPKTLARLHYSVTLRRDEILKNEFGASINEKQGSLYEIKNQLRKYAPLIGLDPDIARITVTEAIQNIIEHGHGSYAHIEMEINNLATNPYMKMSFKHEMKPGQQYTLTQIEENAKKGDINSEYFDFEDARGRGEFLMKELTDERQIINGVELDDNGEKIHYFKRILINYRDPKGPRMETSFDEIREEIDRLDTDDVVCYFHTDHKQARLNSITVITNKSEDHRVRKIMEEAGFSLSHRDTYSRTLFSPYKPLKDVTREEIEHLFVKIRKLVQAEVEYKHGNVEF